jgi:hypothetical protein
MNERKTSSQRPSYRSAKEELAKSTGRVRIYGVELAQPEGKAAIPIWFCGYRTESTDYRKGSRRIFHIPTESIVQRGQLDEFEYEEHLVEWFDVEPHARLLEERFVAFEASSFIDRQKKRSDLTVLERLHGVDSPLFFGGHLGDAPIPIVIPLDPNQPTNPIPIIIPLDPNQPTNPIPIIIPLDPTIA